MAGGDAGAAHVNDMLWRYVAKNVRVALLQFSGRLEISSEIEVVFPRQVNRAGNVAGNFVEWFHRAAEAFFGARIEQAIVVGDADALDFVGIDAQIRVEVWSKRRCLKRGRGCRSWQAFALPTPKVAV